MTVVRARVNLAGRRIPVNSGCPEGRELTQSGILSGPALRSRAKSTKVIKGGILGLARAKNSREDGFQLPPPDSVSSVIIWEIDRPLSKHLPFLTGKKREDRARFLEEGVTT